MLDRLITSKTRLRMLLKFFSQPDATAYLRGLATEFGESTNAIRVELNNLADSGFLRSFGEGRTIRYTANTSHPLFSEIRRLVLRHLEVERIIEKILSRLGRLESAYLTGGYSGEQVQDPIELVLVGSLNEGYVARLALKAEQALGRKIHYVIYSSKEFDVNDLPKSAVIIWGSAGSLHETVLL